MQVHVVNREDMAEIAGWARARGHEWPPPEWLPPTGYWVPGLAAGWLLLTNCGRAFLEDFMINPRADRAESSKALFLIESYCAERALRQGARYLIGTTKIESIRGRVRVAGYEVSDPVFSLHQKVLR